MAICPYCHNVNPAGICCGPEADGAPKVKPEMGYVLLIAGIAGRVAVSNDAPVGQYVKAYNPDAKHGMGLVDGTPDITKALGFETFGEALAFWRQQSKVRPLREDGEANRPLTAFTIEVVKR